ncbi:hypothetical protein ES707_15687 [subsurface metagenome]
MRKIGQFFKKLGRIQEIGVVTGMFILFLTFGFFADHFFHPY